MNNDRYDEAIFMLQSARDYPEAQTPAEHQQRGIDIYRLLHMASEIIVLDLIQEAHYEADIHLHEREK